jgi:16S rRNA (guanine527-N7)-methyltransferase
VPAPLSRAQEESLRIYEELLRERAISLGLVAESDSGRLGERHVRDSLRAASLPHDEDSTLVDIGTGAGLPGLVLAIARPQLHIVLLEPKQRAVGFLELAVDRLGLANVEIRAERVEEADLAADVATSRAYGPIDRSWAAACRVVRPGGRLIYFAGEGTADPEGEARSLTEPERVADVEVERLADSSPLVIMTRDPHVRTP